MAQVREYHGLQTDPTKSPVIQTETKEKTFYFGRGSQACIAVQISPGFRAKIFIGNGKTLEKGAHVTIARDELKSISDFFKALWIERGQDIKVKRLVDDPHDEIFVHNFDFSQFE